MFTPGWTHTETSTPCTYGERIRGNNTCSLIFDTSNGSVSASASDGCQESWTRHEIPPARQGRQATHLQCTTRLPHRQKDERRAIRRFLAVTYRASNQQALVPALLQGHNRITMLNSSYPFHPPDGHISALVEVSAQPRTSARNGSCPGPLCLEILHECGLETNRKSKLLYSP